MQRCCKITTLISSWTDRHEWKHYLPTTSLAGGNNCEKSWDLTENYFHLKGKAVYNSSAKKTYPDIPMWCYTCSRHIGRTSDPRCSPCTDIVRLAGRTAGPGRLPGCNCIPCSPHSWSPSGSAHIDHTDAQLRQAYTNTGPTECHMSHWESPLGYSDTLRNLKWQNAYILVVYIHRQ